MENASKALIIAGAIIISILVIGLGVFIFNNSSSTTRRANLDSDEAQAQNQRFEAYFGDKVTASDVKQLMSLVRSNNLTSDNNDSEKSIEITGKLGTSPNEVSKAVKSGKVYWVGVENDNSGDDGSYYPNGFIKKIYVGDAAPTKPDNSNNP